MPQIKLIKSSFYKEKETKDQLCNFIKNSDILSMSCECKKFEINFSNFQNRKYSVFVSSGSMANLILIQSLLNLEIIKKGDNIGVSALTWATNIMPILQLGLNPILIDCEIENLNISKKILEEKLNKIEIKALFITNVLGFSADIKDIQEFCKRKKILLLEDNCESLGSEYKKTKLGNFGLASTFSFFVGHHMSTIEGGMICTDDEKLAENLVMTRAHGWSRNLDKAKQESLNSKNNIDEFHNKYTFFDLAFNGRPTEINGFLGNLQIQYLREIIQKRAENFFKLQKVSLSNNDIYKLDTSNMNIVSNFAFPVIFRTIELFNQYKKKFEKNNIEIRPIISGNMENQPFFKKYINNLDTYNCINSQIVHEQGFYFGNNPEMTNKEIDYLCNLLRNGQER